MWKKKTNSNGMYWGESLHKYYWEALDKIFNSYANKLEYCMADCTIFCICEQFENNRPSPVIRDINANLWHTVSNTKEGWNVIDYVDGMTLRAGDIVEWEANHVATIEEEGINPLISASWWTNYDGTSKGTRNGAIGTLEEISNFFKNNYQYRFYHSCLLSEENRMGGNNKPPRYVHRLYEVDDTDRDIYKDQILIKTNEQNIRKSYTTESDVIGIAKAGYYNVISKAVKTDFTWYKTNEGWVAGVKGRVEYLPKTEIPETQKTIKELEENITKLTNSYKLVAETNEKLEKEVKELQPYKDNAKQINKLAKEIVELSK